MTLAEFQSTIDAGNEPAVTPLLLALWHDARGDWDEAHRLAQEIETRDGAWVHAYLHRREGDLGNAAYWYQQAGQPVASDSLESEWQRIARALLT